MRLYQCDSCMYQEYREDEPYLCPVCGNMRWTEIVALENNNSETEDD